jgi:hypothetical protein
VGFRAGRGRRAAGRPICRKSLRSISGLVVEYIVPIDVTRVRFPADAYISTPKYIISLEKLRGSERESERARERVRERAREREKERERERKTERERERASER